MTSEDLWMVAADFGDLFQELSPPTHTDMDIAFRRAGVSSPQHDGTKSFNKTLRVTRAFEAAENVGRAKVDDLIRSLTSALATKRHFDSAYGPTEQMLDRLRKDLARVGWGLDHAGNLSPLGTIEVQTGDSEALDQQIKRLRNSGEDVSLMLGTAKDALEAVAKVVLEERGQTFRPDETVEGLINRAMKILEIDVRPKDSSSGVARALAGINQTVPKIAESVRKIRNDEGTGHGRTALASVSRSEAEFVRDLSLSVVNFILAEHRSQSLATTEQPASSASWPDW